MIFTKKEIENITEERINSLKVNQVAEDKHIEYKLILPSEKYDDKKEFLADVSSFTNADGGVIFYGIKAKDGIAEDITRLVIDSTMGCSRQSTISKFYCKRRMDGQMKLNELYIKYEKIN